ncbi:MAG: hypothetical protein CM15mP103_04160 [Gammaproteobacteria bacterium]|nr:MAG: hypothetical protein CM15mP103_04160 [Gammaproteobacteria bacterium]
MPWQCGRGHLKGLKKPCLISRGRQTETSGLPRKNRLTEAFNLTFFPFSYSLADLFKTHASRLNSHPPTFDVCCSEGPYSVSGGAFEFFQVITQAVVAKRSFVISPEMI